MNTAPRHDSSTVPPEPEKRADEHAKGVFVTTRWSQVVLAASRSQADSPSSASSSALASLCESYWYPLYAYVRRRGFGPEDAQDLTQEFFARLLQRGWLGQADRERGRFRTFLLSALNHFLNNEWDKAKALKRGGAAQIVPLKLDSAETRYGHEPADRFTPDQAYDRRWALTLLDRALVALQKEYANAGKPTLFESLKPALLGEATQNSYAELATKLGLSENAIKVTVHRLRKRYRQLLRDEVADTVNGPSEVESEMQQLLKALSTD